MTTRRPTTPRAAFAAAALLAAAALSGCATNPLADQYREGSNKGYISGDFQVVEIAEEDRGDPVKFSGATENGETTTNADYADRVLVVNFWYASCGPCRIEAPVLQEVWESFQDEPVSFLGVNTYDQPGTALSFAETYGITYPSVIDANSGQVKLAFARVAPISATPTTLVLDQQGRVAARIIGQLPSGSILRTLVRDVLAETP